MDNVSRAAGLQLTEALEQLGEWVTEEQYRKQPDLNSRFGPNGRKRTKEDTLYHLRYLAQSVTMSSPLLFIQYIAWLKELLAQFKVTEKDILNNLLLIQQAIEANIDSPYKEELQSYLEMGMFRLAEKAETPSYVREDRPFFEEAKMYLELLLAGERQQAASFIIGQLDQARMSVKELYLYVFQPCQYEIGRLWQKGEITVAQEHFCTACTQSIISSLYPRWLTARSGSKTFVAAGVGSELHEIGLRMLTDFFEMEGWDTYFLGANLPEESLLAFLRKHKPDVVGISATITYHVDLVQKLIGRIRNELELRDVKIMVGGMPFNIDRELWQKVGADGYAPDAQNAVAKAEELTFVNK